MICSADQAVRQRGHAITLQAQYILSSPELQHSTGQGHTDWGAPVHNHFVVRQVRCVGLQAASSRSSAPSFGLWRTQGCHFGGACEPQLIVARRPCLPRKHLWGIVASRDCGVAKHGFVHRTYRNPGRACAVLASRQIQYITASSPRRRHASQAHASPAMSSPCPHRFVVFRLVFLLRLPPGLPPWSPFWRRQLCLVANRRLSRSKHTFCGCPRLYSACASSGIWWTKRRKPAPPSAPSGPPQGGVPGNPPVSPPTPRLEDAILWAPPGRFGQGTEEPPSPQLAGGLGACIGGLQGSQWGAFLGAGGGRGFRGRVSVRACTVFAKCIIDSAPCAGPGCLCRTRICYVLWSTKLLNL